MHQFIGIMKEAEFVSERMYILLTYDIFPDKLKIPQV